MTLQQALSYTGNDYNSMNYEELAEVVKAMAEAARRRISRTPEGPAYTRLKSRALGEGRNVRVRALSYTNDKVRISQRFKGKNKMSLSDVRVLRKELYNYLTDPTSTQKGNREYTEAQNRILQERNRIHEIPDAPVNATTADTDQYLLDICETDSDLIWFGRRHLGWNNDSNPIRENIYEAGGYDAMGTRDFFERLRNQIQRLLNERNDAMTGFDYDEEGMV